METYLTLLYVTLEQELALKEFFIDKGWMYCKPDLSVTTDRVGPAENPESNKTSGKIITYSEISSNNGSKKTKTVVRGEDAGQKKGRLTTFVDATDIKIEVLRDEELTNELHGIETDIINEQIENDDGDNDDDFADDFTINDTGNDTETTGSQRVAKNRNVGKRKKATKLKNGTSSIDLELEEYSASGQKKRKAAAAAEEKIETVMTDELEETELKPMVLLTESEVKKETIPPLRVKKKCNLCPREYTYQCNLDKHCQLVHDPDTPPKPKVKRKHQSRQCDICGSVFQRSDILLDHKRRVHEGVRMKIRDRRCTCEFCGATFKKSTHLKEHVMVKHSNSKLPHACNMCEKSFIRARFLETHLNRAHLNYKPFGCQFCNKKFYSKLSARNHMKMKVCKPDREKKFKCIQCEKRFPDAKHLEMHMTAKHFGGAYKCVCGDVIEWASSIAKHKRKCKEYKEYAEVNCETSEKLCNVIEVLYSDVVVENKKVTDTGSTEETEGDISSNLAADIQN